ncbi:MAG: hypothetical protein QF781_03570 [Phycisphaerales bacterium]|jgi:hypothetical protein|nr:hypothetical protein [Phycisphaerales bacterium]MDP6311221.1 hypothetical protein [Phycisphaerales bacterium]MDP7086380.1 hypothetical protein [Phycisphaerales bacterium]MDP7189334.1 hypothetical protein [Phycisphaerales bacterium]MDP7519990.1 hypothetical protein [Phycisphaerales bacterium]|tara:strand:- start:496 stop:1812 length:1317 start_codon:yes stop_codon:yes gene_type:complete
MTILPLLYALLMAPSMGDRLISDELGVSLSLPPDSILIQRPGDAGSHFMIRDGRSVPTWSLKIESWEVENVEPEACLRAVLEKRMPGQTPPAGGAAVTHDPSGRPMATHWASQTAQNGREVALGWLVAPQSLGRCLVLSVVRTADSDHRGALEQVFKSVQLLDRATDKTELAAGLNAGKSILNSLTESDLRSLVGRRAVLRVYNPNAEQHGEVAYGTLEAKAAPRSAIRGRPGPISEAEREEGLLVTSHLRFVENPETDAYSDRVQRCWVSWDLQREAWVDSVTHRVGDNRTAQEEIVIRSPPSLGIPRGQLLVIRQDEAHGTRNTWTLVPEDPWLPRALRWLVWDLPGVDQSKRVAWHVWDETTSTPRTTFRRDAWDADAVGRRCWSWSGIDGLPTALSFDQDGRWIRATRSDGTVIEVSDKDTVTNRWKAAGLKMR